MNLVIFASDAKALSSLNSLISTASSMGIKVFAMVTQSTKLKHPTTQQQNFQIISNVDKKPVIKSNSLGVYLPFKPDWLIVSRERWDPELNIIKEFKLKFGCKVGLVEPNSHILNNAETRLEVYSKNRFINLIDKFFIHSSHAKYQQQLAGFTGNMVVTGNPKYDLNLKPNPKTLTQLNKLYNIDPNKKQVLLFSLVNQHRNDINAIFKNIVTSKPENQYFYKPYPGEPFLSKYSKDFSPKFFLDNCTPILEENHIWGMFEICNKHIGCMSSITHATLLSRSEYQDVSLELNLPKKYLDFSNVFQDGGPGLENNKAMWMRSFGFTSESQLRNLLPIQYKKEIKKPNDKVWNNLDNPEILLKLFDDYNDGNASKRIINELQK
jgi:hypothetical protein